jgi:hypothetical protein
MTLICTHSTRKLSRLYNQLITQHVYSFATGSWETSSSARKKIIYDKATFNRDGMSNARNPQSGPSIILTHPRKYIQNRFSVNIWCSVIGSQVIGPFVLEGRLTSERYLRFLEDGLPVLRRSYPHQATTVTAARWRRYAGSCIFQLKFFKAVGLGNRVQLLGHRGHLT